MPIIYIYIYIYIYIFSFGQVVDWVQQDQCKVTTYLNHAIT